MRIFLLRPQGAKLLVISIKDEKKLFSLAKIFDVKTEGREINEIAEEVGEMGLAEFGKSYGNQKLVKISA